MWFCLGDIAQSNKILSSEVTGVSQFQNSWFTVSLLPRYFYCAHFNWEAHSLWGYFLTYSLEVLSYIFQQHFSSTRAAFLFYLQQSLSSKTLAAIWTGRGDRLSELKKSLDLSCILEFVFSVSMQIRSDNFWSEDTANGLQSRSVSLPTIIPRIVLSWLLHFDLWAITFLLAF